MANPDGVTRGTLEDVGKSMLICDVCEEMVSKGGRFHDGDECPVCRDAQAIREGKAKYDEQDARATAQVWADGKASDAVANLARAYAEVVRERDALLETMRTLTREQSAIVAASVANDNALAAGYRADCTRALRKQAMGVLAVVRGSMRYYPSQSTDGWNIMREEEEEIRGEWVNVNTLLEALRRMLLTDTEPGGAH